MAGSGQTFTDLLDELSGPTGTSAEQRKAIAIRCSEYVLKVFPPDEWVDGKPPEEAKAMLRELLSYMGVER